MSPIAIPELQERLEPAYYWPTVSITVPFEPKMVEKSGLAHSLKIILDKVENDLKHDNPADCRHIALLQFY